MASGSVADNKIKINQDDGEIVVKKDVLPQGLKHAALVIENSTNSKFTIPKSGDWRIIKLFIDDCEDCHFELEHLLITQHLEISHCSNITLNVRAPLATVQLDLCDGVKIQYQSSNTKIYHAGVKSLQITHKEMTHEANYTDHDIPEHIIPEEQQFLTEIVQDEFCTKFCNRGLTFGKERK